jgi:hypothetical protein
MHIVESCQIASVISQPAIPEVKPHVSTQIPIEAIYHARSVCMQVLHELSQIAAVRLTSSDEMVVISEDCPGFQLPMMLAGYSEQVSLEQG